MIFNWFKNLFEERERLGGMTRSPQWKTVRKNFLTNNSECAVCGGTNDLEAHHIFPFHLHPEEELNPANLITLCRQHHYEWGHFFSWRSFNKDIVEDAKLFKSRVKNRP